VTNSPDVIVVGGGVIGLSAAWRCRQRGLDVTLVDPVPGRGASHTAAGMLAPVTELTYNEQALLGLNLASAQMYPAFVEELEALADVPVGYRRSGTLEVAWDSADLGYLKDLQTFQRSVGVTSELVTGREVRQLEPLVASGIPGGLFAADDHQVDNRALISALSVACRATGVHFLGEKVTELLPAPDNGIRGVRTDKGSQLVADMTVLAAGAASAVLSGASLEAPTLTPVPVRPVKGQTLRLRHPAGLLLQHVLRGSVKGSPIYLVARDNGEVVVGASSEEQGFDISPRAGVVYELMRDAIALVPQLSECEWVEVSTNLRPGTPDNAPIIGRAEIDGLIFATGHYRNGILLAPITATAVADLASGMHAPAEVAPFNVARFAGPRIPTEAAL
jgi:glycine oxidase